MFIEVYIKRGFRGTSTQIMSTDVTPDHVKMEAEHSGSYHILSMGQHYHQYIITLDLLAFLRSRASLPLILMSWSPGRSGRVE